MCSSPLHDSDIMTLTTMKHNIYSSLCEPEGNTTNNSVLIEAKFNLMQATFVTLQSSSLDEETLFKGQATFHTLFTRYFKETVEV